MVNIKKLYYMRLLTWTTSLNLLLMSNFKLGEYINKQWLNWNIFLLVLSKIMSKIAPLMATACQERLTIFIVFTHPGKILPTYRAFILEAENPHASGTLKTYGMVAFPDREIQDILETHYTSSIIIRLCVGHVFD